MCGAISEYDASAPVPGPDNLFLAVAKNLTLRGFRGSSYVDRRDEMESVSRRCCARAGSAIRRPSSTASSTRRKRSRGCCRGDTFGKTVVKIADVIVETDGTTLYWETAAPASPCCS